MANSKSLMSRDNATQDKVDDAKLAVHETELLTAINKELVEDPVKAGYSSMSTAQIVASLNKPGETTPPRWCAIIAGLAYAPNAVEVAHITAARKLGKGS